MMQEIHSHQYDEDWKLIYPQEVRVGELMRSPTTVPNYFISFRRAPDGGDTIRFEHAARGWDGRVYPWGDNWIADRAERLSKPSPWGIYGLCGEVWTWTQDEYVADRRPLIQQEEKIK
jgi:hypothetical protein